tara:strand:- start:39 stop:497 length:459 start_codon:yes stop_codon:yes gene_type:complete
MTWSVPFFNQAADKGLRALESSLMGLRAEVTCKPYWNIGFHATSLFTMATHVLRSLNNALSLISTVLSAPLLLFTPWNIPFIPVALVEHALAAIISLISVVITPVFFAFRTLSSMIVGYQEGSDLNWDWNSSKEDERNDWNDATTIFIPSAS